MKKYTHTSLKKRTQIFLLCVLCVAVAISGRLVYIQIFSSANLRFLAAEQWYRDLPLMAERGKILDANGRVLTESALTYSVYVRPVSVVNPDKVADVLAATLDVNRDLTYQKVTSRTVSEWLIKMQVSKLAAMNIVMHNLDGVFISQTYERTYPLGTTGGQILGLVSIDGIGQGGVEAYYNQILSGTNGKVAQPSDLRGKTREKGVQYYSEPIAGYDLILNTDSVMQSILQTALNTAYFEQGAQSVSGLIYDIETGGILASASAPFYDMNNQPRDDLATLMGQIKNSPIADVLEPGSTFKILTLAAAIEEGCTHENDKFMCPGYRMIGGERVKCWKTKGHGSQTLAEGVRNSCNCVFMDLALRLGVDKFYDYLKKFGIGQKTGVDFYGESRGLVLDKKWVRPVDLARIGFGQAVAVSPIQFQSIISAIVGDGKLKTPHFAKEIPQANCKIPSETRRQIVSKDTSERVRELLYGVVSAGSGKHSGVSGYQIGGKTGTAQKYKDGIIDQGHYISSFTGFLSVNGKPKYSVMLLVDEPSKMGYYGSIVAAPYVGQIFSALIDYLRIPADPQFAKPGSQVPVLVSVPSVAGMPIAQAVAQLQALGFFVEVQDDGTVASGTFPAAGTRLEKGSPVVVSTVD